MATVMQEGISATTQQMLSHSAMETTTITNLSPGFWWPTCLEATSKIFVTVVTPEVTIFGNNEVHTMRGRSGPTNPINWKFLQR